MGSMYADAKVVKKSPVTRTSDGYIDVEPTKRPMKAGIPASGKPVIPVINVTYAQETISTPKDISKDDDIGFFSPEEWEQRGGDETYLPIVPKKKLEFDARERARIDAHEKKMEEISGLTKIQREQREQNGTFGEGHRFPDSYDKGFFPDHPATAGLEKLALKGQEPAPINGIVKKDVKDDIYTIETVPKATTTLLSPSAGSRRQTDVVQEDYLQEMGHRTDGIWSPLKKTGIPPEPEPEVFGPPKPDSIEVRPRAELTYNLLSEMERLREEGRPPIDVLGSYGAAVTAGFVGSWEGLVPRKTETGGYSFPETPPVGIMTPGPGGRAYQAGYVAGMILPVTWPGRVVLGGGVLARGALGEATVQLGKNLLKYSPRVYQHSPTLGKKMINVGVDIALLTTKIPWTVRKPWKAAKYHTWQFKKGVGELIAPTGTMRGDLRQIWEHKGAWNRPQPIPLVSEMKQTIKEIPGDVVGGAKEQIAKVLFSTKLPWKYPVVQEARMSRFRESGGKLIWATLSDPKGSAMIIPSQKYKGIGGKVGEAWAAFISTHPGAIAPKLTWSGTKAQHKEWVRIHNTKGKDAAKAFADKIGEKFIDVPRSVGSGLFRGSIEDMWHVGRQMEGAAGQLGKIFDIKTRKPLTETTRIREVFSDVPGTMPKLIKEKGWDLLSTKEKESLARWGSISKPDSEVWAASMFSHPARTVESWLHPSKFTGGVETTADILAKVKKYGKTGLGAERTLNIPVPEFVAKAVRSPTGKAIGAVPGIAREKIWEIHHTKFPVRVERDDWIALTKDKTSALFGFGKGGKYKLPRPDAIGSSSLAGKTEWFNIARLRAAQEIQSGKVLQGKARDFIAKHDLNPFGSTTTHRDNPDRWFDIKEWARLPSSEGGLPTLSPLSGLPGQGGQIISGQELDTAKRNIQIHQGFAKQLFGGLVDESKKQVIKQKKDVTQTF